MTPQLSSSVASKLVTLKLKPVVVFGPSGVGKSTLLKRLLKDHGDKLGFSVSHTTRTPRAGEKDGIDYHFVTKEEFQKLVAEEKFVEWAVFSGNMYGTSIMAIQELEAVNKKAILDIDLQGVLQVKASPIDAQYVFLAPPSIEQLEVRLRGRGTENESAILQRLERARAEIEYSEKPGNFDALIVNDDVEKAYKQLEAICLSD
ncbi:Guanylate kinase [Schizosaccharomyces pombe]|uniref:Guanylate kinase n=1 Tax=Schizosaccharomyces pombe (strain 972 / ATCC 24843) TaxID=284812 RepID=KGUA_SCHPO|nr:putative guanylate kinase [Schizosaccharomyces pombe]Q9P6I5.1 RecName: Full=Guanylate kinase; AltName: Full=GMP kinase [Schizosaccharomyces pombe 972h-]CAB91180.1 guanylate kinase (predicted) [Schizosaccharomyces pombe]|eukprot:NP_595074.1 putative guanylate kinase [Schizosaccharomyces pombe]